MDTRYKLTWLADLAGESARKFCKLACEGAWLGLDHEFINEFMLLLRVSRLNKECSVLQQIPL